MSGRGRRTWWVATLAVAGFAGCASSDVVPPPSWERIPDPPPASRPPEAAPRDHGRALPDRGRPVDRDEALADAATVAAR
ncbi:MAG TPA: hypothetical protein VEI02_01925 [Planctomycetota bacterium]|nr:hypothetical protein [Planctomycetota bacterium]